MVIYWFEYMVAFVNIFFSDKMLDQNKYVEM